jgi:Zn-dependent protease with chaperone function
VAQYITATVFYSLITALVVEALIRIWAIYKPSTKFKIRLLILLLPIFYWPAYNLIYPQRGGELFRHGKALLDLEQWLGLEIAGVIPLWYGLLFLLLLTTVLFLVQEVVPTVSSHLSHRSQQGHKIEEGQYPELELALNEVAQKVHRPVPQVFVVNLEAPTVYTVGAGKPALTVSSNLAEMLDKDELRGVLAHELAHLIRRDSWWGWALLLMRALMFYNPVALLTFRQLTQDNEQACDDIAVSATGKPLAFAAGLIKVFRAEKPATSTKALRERRWLYSQANAIYEHANLAAVKRRAARQLNPPPAEGLSYENFRLILVSSMLAVLLFFVV